MPKTKNKPGIHLYIGLSLRLYYWHIRAKNGRVTANGETYKTKQGALDGISSVAKSLGGTGRFKYYDHTRQGTKNEVIPLKSYL